MSKIHKISPTTNYLARVGRGSQPAAKAAPSLPGAPALVLDYSESMDWRTSNGERRIDALRQVVAGIRRNRTIPMIAFGDDVEIVDEIPEPSGSTPLARAIDEGGRRNFDHLIVISDGEPDSRGRALAAARGFRGRIDFVYVGPEDPEAREFMRNLAATTGGTQFSGDLSRTEELSNRVRMLLGSGGQS